MTKNSEDLPLIRKLKNHFVTNNTNFSNVFSRGLMEIRISYHREHRVKVRYRGSREEMIFK